SAPPLGPIEEWVARCRREAAEHAALTDAAEQQRLTRALAELEAREELSKRLPEVLAHLNALKELARLAEAKRKLNTSALSNTMTALSRELIEADLQGALNRHLTALNFNGLAVLVRSKTVRGHALVGLRFKTVDGVPLNSVLSQGEQRRLALAMFLAEMEVLGEPNPVVLDDPASSIDQEGRRHIARTLCELARRQQVIVFTHELSFVHELGRCAPDALLVGLQHVCRNGATVGHVREGLPWEGMKARARRQELQNRLGRLRELYEQQDDERYRSAASEFCVALRAAFERAVEEEILGETVTRRYDTIHTKNLSKVVCTQQICALVDRGVDDCSPWAHDRPLADGADPPTPDELGAGLEVYGELLELTRAERSSRLTGARSPDPSQEIYAERREKLSVVANPEQREPSRRPA
ncbi:MAG: AAA family ATPase, partial [Solirubrobacteraceae bacterium]